MKKLTFVLATVAVVGLVALAAMAAQDKDSAKVGFSLVKYFSLNVVQGANVEFGNIDPLKKSYSKNNATSLSVSSNTSWAISTSKKVLNKPNSANNNSVLNALNVKLETSNGTGNDSDIKVGYTLSNLANLPAGDYVVEVTFTGSTK